MSLLASLRIWSSKIIGDIGVDDDMTQHMLLEGCIRKFENYILESKPQVCASATQDQPLVSTSKLHVRYGARMLINSVLAGRAYLQRSNVKTLVDQTVEVSVAQPFAECGQNYIGGIVVSIVTLEQCKPVGVGHCRDAVEV